MNENIPKTQLKLLDNGDIPKLDCSILEEYTKQFINEKKDFTGQFVLYGTMNVFNIYPDFVYPVVENIFIKIVIII